MRLLFGLVALIVALTILGWMGLGTGQSGQPGQPGEAQAFALERFDAFEALLRERLPGAESLVGFVQAARAAFLAGQALAVQQNVNIAATGVLSLLEVARAARQLEAVEAERLRFALALLEDAIATALPEVGPLVLGLYAAAAGDEAEGEPVERVLGPFLKDCTRAVTIARPTGTLELQLNACTPIWPASAPEADEEAEAETEAEKP